MRSEQVRLVLVLAVGLVLGVAIGWSARGGSAAEPGPMSLGGQLEPAPTPADTSAPSLVTHEPERVERQVAPPISARKAALPEAPIRAAAAEMHRLEHPRGDGAISGRVLDEEGRGVADVVLHASFVQESSTLPSRIGPAPPAIDDFERILRSAARRHVERLAETWVTRSDEDGSYRFEGLPDRRYRLEAYKLDWALEPIGEGRGEVPTGARLDFVARPVISVPVSVALAGGGAPERALLMCEALDERPSWPRPYSWSPSEPALRLTPGRWGVAAFSEEIPAGSLSGGDEYGLRAERQTIELRPGEVPAPLSFVLEARTGIAGRVGFARDGVLDPSASLALLPLGPTSEPDLELLAASDRTIPLRGDADYSFLDLEPGRYVVGVVRGRRIVAHEVLTVMQGLARCDLDVPPLDLSRHLLVEVLDAAGERLRDVALRFEQTSAGAPLGNGSAGGLRHEDGRLVVAIPEASLADYLAGTPGHAFWLVVYHGDRRQKGVALQPGQRELTVTLGEPAALELSIAGGAAFEGRLGVGLLAGRDREQLRNVGYEAVDLGGGARFEGLEPGEYALRVSVTPRGGRSHPVVQREVELLPGRNELSVALPPLHELTVRFLAEGSGGRADLEPLRSEGEGPPLFRFVSADLDRDGFARFEAIPAGRYRLLVARDGLATARRELDVPCAPLELAPDR